MIATMMNNYLFTSKRLGFRNWIETDIAEMHQINSDEKVMEFFPSQPTLEQTNEFIKRMQTSFEAFGYCYFAVEIIETNEFIGFIGFSNQTFKSDFTPFVDIGWRLKKTAWNKGFATEGAKACLNYGFENLKFSTVFAIAPKLNGKSQHVMKKIGMKQYTEFNHPNIKDGHPLKECVLFKI